ncbi:SubName: Full=Uncharacterized protein {ECO:0000313/EMBL:CCA67582.1} [Serendipita indica DSM 11827]|uniref:Ribosomal protein S6 n=1 Tax=Serendipita indica (strain DSM 11827) TaxID=1109443 RepID=G4T8C9_SERID|nr:SubName: Full=Uncharacterized protein {ECO:0000313/EMBL:CCA67582.1} [Serendipita indica DSM 11827]CCA67582.1 hypothetical protein PIIN_01410 [Serendipita indica DSM 11827]
MPFYQLLCISTHYSEFKFIRTLVKTSAMQVFNAGGVVRDIRFLGTRILPARMKRHTRPQTLGDYWVMHFDANPKIMQDLEARLRQDPTVLRWTTLKLGSSLMKSVQHPSQTEFERSKPGEVLNYFSPTSR